MPIATKSSIDAEMARGAFTYDAVTGALVRLSTGYRYSGDTIHVFGEHRETSRFIWLIHYGEWPPLDKLVDHKDRNRKNWRIANLRLATYPENAYNAASRNDLVKGVTFDANRVKKWRAQIRIKGRKTNLGRFHTMEEAAKAYVQAATKHHGKFLCLE